MMRTPLRGVIGLAVLLSFGGMCLGATYTATLGPEAPGATGTGFTTITLDTVAHTLRVEATFSGLSGTTTVAHIHAPTAAVFTGSAGVAIQAPTFSGLPVGVTAGVMDQTLDTTLTSVWNATFLGNHGGTALGAEAALAAYLASGRAYLNIHTSTFPGGEIRGFLPEPASLALLLAGGVVAFRRRSVAR